MVPTGPRATRELRAGVSRPRLGRSGLARAARCAERGAGLCARPPTPPADTPAHRARALTMAALCSSRAAARTALRSSRRFRTACCCLLKRSYSSWLCSRSSWFRRVRVSSEGGEPGFKAEGGGRAPRGSSASGTQVPTSQATARLANEHLVPSKGHHWERGTHPPPAKDHQGTPGDRTLSYFFPANPNHVHVFLRLLFNLHCSVPAKPSPWAICVTWGFSREAWPHVRAALFAIPLCSARSSPLFEYRKC